MQYSTEVTIQKPIQKVIELFQNPDNAFKWMEGLSKFELIEGKLGEVGAKSNIEFQMGKRTMQMVETILESNLPKNIKFEYNSPGSYNTVNHFFKDNGDGTTKHIAESYFKFSSIGMRFMAWIMPGLFKKTEYEIRQRIQTVYRQQKVHYPLYILSTLKCCLNSSPMLMKYIPSGRPFRFISVSSPSITSDNTSTP